MSATGSVPSSLVVSKLFGAQTDFSRFDWQHFREGVEIARLYGGAEGPSAALLRYAAGARVPVHLHRGMEHIVVLAGSQSDEDGGYEAGSLIMHRAGTKHSVVSAEGCIVLAIWEQPVEILNAQSE